MHVTSPVLEKRKVPRKEKSSQATHIRGRKKKKFREKKKNN